MKITNFDVRSVASIEDIQRFISQTMAQVVTIINGKIAINDNLDSRLVNVTFTSAAVDTQVTHNLGRIAIGYILTVSSAPMSIYNGVTAGDSNNIFLRTNNPGSTTILVF